MTVAWAALILWPVVCIVIYQCARLPVALCVTLIGGYLLLPTGVSWNPPVLPHFDKITIPVLTAMALTAAAIASRDQKWPVLKGWIPRTPVVVIFLCMLVFGPFGTVFTNTDPLFYGTRFLPGMRVYDGFSLTLDVLVAIVPFLLARRVLATPEGHRVLLLAIAISALLYTLPTLYEVRMSPQLHAMVYGFFPHSWLQAVRAGGFRPSVFLGHGLALSLFLALAVIAAAGLFRAGKPTDRLKWVFSLVFLLIVLVLTRSLGPLMIASVLVAVALFCATRTQFWIAAALAAMVLLYPLARTLEVAPVYRIAAMVESVNPERSHTFVFRLQNEERLLAKANERPVFGWGSWSRNRVFNEYGQDITVIDGVWIGALGTGGWVRYISLFGLLCWPIIALFLRRGSYLDPYSAALALVLMVNVIDLIPNAGLLPLTWLMAGALAGRLEMGQTTQEPAVVTGNDPPPAASRYARNFVDKKKRPAAVTTTRKPAELSPHRRAKPTTGYSK